MSPRLLDLFYRVGGATIGYLLGRVRGNRGRDIEPQPNYPLTFHQGDAPGLPVPPCCPRIRTTPRSSQPPRHLESRLMRAITIKAPWTVPILLGIKTVENRRHNTHYRGPLAIHVSRTWCPDGATDPRVSAAAYRRALGQRPHIRALATTPGAVVAVAELVDCHRADGRCCPDWGRPTDWHLTLADVQPLTYPLPARGALGVWPVPSLLAAAITIARTPPTLATLEAHRG